uniref:SLC2A4 regulator n=1 Tax=Varanus komodoensis TaxID=61221 RepID=A0A8D2KR42_VARKO
MEPKPRLFKRSASPGGSGRICSPPPGLTSAGPCCPDSSPPAAGLYCGVISACNKPLPAAASNAVYTVLVEDPASLRRRSRRRSAGEDGAGKNPGGKGRLQLLQKSPSHCNGKVFPGEAESINGQLRSLSDPLGLKQPEEEAAALRLLEQSPLHQSAYIPVPRQRRLSEKAGIDEVMAAAVLTSLSTSPVVLNHAPNGFGTEMNGDAWKEGLGMSSSCSSNSGDWSWDAPSDLSTPSTPSPPLSTDAAPSFLSSLQSELEETEATHFLFGDPIPRKRKNSTKVMFKCLWKNCGKVLSSSSGMQKHIRTIHLGRKADLDQSDGEEDFYYTELDVNVDSLTDGLSSLTPVSPTSSVPPAFPILEEVQETPPIPFKPEVSMVSHLSQSTPMTILSQSAPTSLCHIQTDHAYQASGPAGVLTDLTAPATGMEISISWQQPALFPPPLPPVLFKSPAVSKRRPPGCSLGQEGQLLQTLDISA